MTKGEIEMEDYDYYMAQAAKYREMARFQDEHVRRIWLGVVQVMESNAKDALRRQDGGKSSPTEMEMRASSIVG